MDIFSSLLNVHGLMSAQLSRCVYGTVGKQVYRDQLYFVDFVLSHFTISYKKWFYIILRDLYACYSATFFIRSLNDNDVLFRWAVLDFDPPL